MLQEMMDDHVLRDGLRERLVQVHRRRTAPERRNGLNGHLVAQVRRCDEEPGIPQQREVERDLCYSVYQTTSAV